MTELPYRLEPAPGYDEYKISSLLKDYLETLMEQAENKEAIDQILAVINGYTAQLKNLRTHDRLQAIREIYKAIDGFFAAAPQENKKDIQCKEGCTACCFIDVDLSEDEAAVIVDHCKENKIEIDKDYLMQQAAVGRKTYSPVSKCVFLKDDLCSIYPVRPIACRKHWVKTDPALCDFSNNIVNPVGGYFDVNTEVLASAMLNVSETKSLEKALLAELDKTSRV